MTLVAGLPAPRFDHLLHLVDDTGVFEHARYGVPRREYGYATDDAARALIVLTRAPSLPPIERAISTVLAFLLDAVSEDGMVRNRLGYDRTWEDAPGLGDHHGRAYWALAVVAATGSRQGWRDAARDTLAGFALPDGPHLRPYAFAALGAAQLWESFPGDGLAGKVIDRAVEALGEVEPLWPEPRLTYDNGRIPNALIRLGEVTGEAQLIDRGLELLDWLHRVEQRDGHYSFTPVGGWSPGEPRPGFDQQPIEAAAMAEAAFAAWRVTGERRWAEATLAAGRWLTGDNDVGARLYQEETGACFDGLTSRGVNANQGAESTIAALVVLQSCAGLVAALTSDRVATARERAASR